MRRRCCILREAGEQWSEMSMGQSEAGIRRSRDVLSGVGAEADEVHARDAEREDVVHDREEVVEPDGEHGRLVPRGAAIASAAVRQLLDSTAGEKKRTCYARTNVCVRGRERIETHEDKRAWHSLGLARLKITLGLLRRERTRCRATALTDAVPQVQEPLCLRGREHGDTGGIRNSSSGLLTAVQTRNVQAMIQVTYFERRDILTVLGSSSALGRRERGRG